MISANKSVTEHSDPMRKSSEKAPPPSYTDRTYYVAPRTLVREYGAKTKSARLRSDEIVDWPESQQKPKRVLSGEDGIVRQRRQSPLHIHVPPPPLDANHFWATITPLPPSPTGSDSMAQSPSPPPALFPHFPFPPPSNPRSSPSLLEEQFQYFQQEPFALNLHAFSLDRHGAIRKKTLTGPRVSHVGNPSRPTATSPLSRDQPAFDLTLWVEDGLSNSLAFEGESFEPDTLDLDMRNFYQQNTTGEPQASHRYIPSVNTTVVFVPHGIISEQGMLIQSLYFTSTNRCSRTSCISTNNDGSTPPISTSVSYSDTACRPLSPRAGSA
jgi:hypothetical protein